MKAVRYFGHKDVRIVHDLEKPTPTGDQVLVKIAGAGVCHSDLHIIDEGTIPPGNTFTLGHENAGYIEAVGPNKIHVEIEQFPMDQILEVYDRMRAGKLKGRAVLVP